MTPARSFSPAVEDYLKAIYRLEGDAGEPVTTNALRGWLGVTAPSASGMLKKLDDMGLRVIGSSAEELGQSLKSDMAKWGALIKAAGIKASPE